ncbi:MAG TPA: PAS domain-containing protein [Longimicrobium sp.]|nr:PAS domain-containing protein [Longimicrobium sp.]
MNDSRLSRDYTAQLLPRLQELRTAAAAPAPRDTLPSELIEELQTAIEELRVTEEELRSQQGQLEDAWLAAETASDWNRALFDGAADAMLVTDAEGVVRDANAAAGTLLNLSARSMRGKPLAVFIPSEERAEFRARLRGLVDEPLPVLFDVSLQPRLAVPVAVEASVARFAPPGARAGLHWILRDVSAARQREEGERDAGRGNLRALRALPSATVVLDVDGTVSLWNAAAEQLLGWSEDEAAGVRAPCWSPGTEQALEAALEAADGAPVHLTLPARTRDGRELAVDVGAARLEDEAGDPRGIVLALAPAHDDGPAPVFARPAWSEPEMRRVLLLGTGDLADRMRTGIAAGLFLGHLRPGDRLPSIREVARFTGEDHRCVSAAYRRLSSEGVVEVRNRHGVLVGPGPQAPEMPASETAAWLAGVIGEAAALQVKVTQLPELTRRWTAQAPVRCLCVDGTEDGLASLAAELHAQWGFETQRFLTGGPESTRRDALAAAMREADVVVTTPFHVHAVDAAAQSSGTPVVVLDADPELVTAAEARLRAGGLTAVVADARYGERLRCLTGGERLRVVLADDAEAVAALDPSDPVLMTRAAQQRVGQSLRLLAPVSPAFSASRARALAAVLIQRNLRAQRALTV